MKHTYWPFDFEICGRLSLAPKPITLADKSLSRLLLEDRIAPKHFGVDEHGYDHNNPDSESQVVCDPPQPQFNPLYANDVYKRHERACALWRMTSKSVMAAEYKQFSILRALGTELRTLHLACGRLRSSPSWQLHTGSNLSTGRRISTLEADRVLDRVDRLGQFIGTFSRGCFRVVAQAWL